MKTFVIGDIHGAYKALRQCLERSKFDKARDRLICLGDVCDRGSQVKESIDELLTIPHCVYILGNHDAWALEWGKDGNIPQGWWDQGGAQTAMSYKGTGMPKEHIQFLSQAHLSFVDQNNLFVHGGFDPGCPIAETPREILIWDRTLIRRSQELQLTSPNYKFGNYNAVFIGHTPTINFGQSQPQQWCNLWAMDTGAGWGAQLTIMDVDTKEFWQSDMISDSFRLRDGGGYMGGRKS